MKRVISHSKTSLFLTEMIFALLILSLVSSICIQVFAVAFRSRIKAREYNHIQELSITVGEILEGSDGTAYSFLRLLPGGRTEGACLNYYYDRTWNSCTPQNACYRMHLSPLSGSEEKSVKISFYNDMEELLYTLSIRFPRITTEVLT